jgi:DNA-binding NarL/FixJ family response regulator
MTVATPTKTCEILIVDDHPLVRKGLRSVIEENKDYVVVGECSTTTEAIRLFEELRPSLAIIDLTLEDGHGLDLIKKLSAVDDQLPMLAVSMHDENVFAERVLKAGAMGYVHKIRATEEINAAIHRVLNGRIYLSPDVSDQLLRQMTQGHESESGVERLSDRELAVFQLIGQGHTTREIAGKLFLSHKTVETHRERIKKKLHIGNSIHLVKRAVEWVIESDNKTPEPKGPVF